MRWQDGLTPLHCTARSGHEAAVDLLLERGAQVLAKTKNGLEHRPTIFGKVKSSSLLWRLMNHPRTLGIQTLKSLTLPDDVLVPCATHEVLYQTRHSFGTSDNIAEVG